jgi:hypothetical protein
VRHKTKYKDLNEAERQLQALDLRRRGYSYRKIAAELECGLTTAFRDCTRHLEDVREKCREKAEQINDLDLERLDEALMAIWDKVEQGDCKSIETMLKIMERRAKMLGLDSPDRHEVKTGVATPEEAAQLVRQLFGANAAKPDDVDGEPEGGASEV